ncbi:MAG: hypothetical protein AAFY88_03615 [Acidobacteriota bacterium]
MTRKHNRVVVITFDASTRRCTANPDRVEMPYGCHKLFFALQTTHAPGGAQASFASIRGHEGSVAKAVANTPQLSMIDVPNDNDGPSDVAIDYDVTIHYQDEAHPHDPTVILKPPTAEPPETAPLAEPAGRAD